MSTADDICNELREHLHNILLQYDYTVTSPKCRCGSCNHKISADYNGTYLLIYVYQEIGMIDIQFGFYNSSIKRSISINLIDNDFDNTFTKVIDPKGAIHAELTTKS